MMIASARGLCTSPLAKLNAATREALADGAVRKRTAARVYFEVPRPEMQTSSALRTFQAAEIEMWWPIIRPEKITPE